MNLFVEQNYFILIKIDGELQGFFFFSYPTCCILSSVGRKLLFQAYYKREPEALTQNPCLHKLAFPNWQTKNDQPIFLILTLWENSSSKKTALHFQNSKRPSQFSVHHNATLGFVSKKKEMDKKATSHSLLLQRILKWQIGYSKKKRGRNLQD